MKLNSLFLILLILFTSSTPLNIQKGIFTFPINPGSRNYLAGSMGELRSNHFHGGLDIKTGGRIGLDVHAAEEGYISRISVSPSGYGKRIAITHPNGFVTEYGHLDHFSIEIEKYVLDIQYKKREFDIEISPKPYELKLNKGDVFAYSGNTGSSGGPHLHFEIRDTLDNVYNPLDFGFREIVDGIAPSVYEIAIKPLGIKSLVQGIHKKAYFRLGYKSGRYVVNNDIKAIDLVGLEIKAYDKMNGTYNKYGIQEIQVWVNGERYFEQNIDYFPISLNRHINLHVDYHDLFYRGSWYQKCYVSNGNKLPFYKFKENNGALKIEDGKTYDIQIFIKDSYKNSSLLEFQIVGDKKVYEPKTRSLIYKPEFTYDLDGTKVQMELKNVSKEQKLDLYSFYKHKTLAPLFFTEESNIYLYDLNEGILDSIKAADSTYFLPFRYMILPGKKTEYYFDPVKVIFDETSLSDTIFIKHQTTDSTLTFHETKMPLASDIRIEWEIKNPKFVNNSQVYFKFYKDLRFLGNNWKGNKVSFNTNKFGTYVLANDTTPPYVRMIYNTGAEMKLRISDNLSGISKYDVFVKDKWILMEYDAKRNLLTSKRKDLDEFLRGPCLIRVSDRAGNVKELNLNL